MELICRGNVMNTANLLTLSRFVLLPAIICLFRQGNLIGALTVYLLSMVTDVADGFVARRFHQQTSLGKLLDPLADKLSLLVMLGLFVSDSQVPRWVFTLVLLKEAALILGSVLALDQGIVVEALPVGKATTFCFMLMAVFHLLSLHMIADVFLSVSLFLSLAALIWYGWALLSRIKTGNTVSTK